MSRGPLAGLLGPMLLLGASAARAQPGGQDFDDLDLDALLAPPTVESASKRKQSLEEAPGAISVIESEDLLAAGPITLADALRAVPGVWVFQTDANMFHVGLRGLGTGSSSPVVVLVNGRRFSDLSLGYALWYALPVHVGEIERIEILRGPGATLYGADALNGVINIVTKHGKDLRGVEGTFVAGAGILPRDPKRQGLARINNLGKGYLAGNYQSADGRVALRGAVGLEHLAEWQDIADAAQADVYRSGGMGYHASVTADWQPSADVTSWIDLRHVTAEGHAAYEATATTSVSISEQSLAFSFEKRRAFVEPLSIKLTGDARYGFQSGNPQRQERLEFWNRTYHLLAQGDLELWDGASILTTGLEGAYRNSDGFLDRSYDVFYGAALAQSETAFADRRLLINVAGRYEAIRSVADTGLALTYGNFSPRVSVIGRVARAHTVRASAATSYRTPTPFQTFIDALPETYPAPIPPAYAVAANPSLRPEQLRSVEVGYRGRPAYWLRLDATAFVQEATALIDAPYSTVPIHTFNWRDETHMGFELGAQIRPRGAMSADVNYAVIDTRSPQETGLRRFPPHILSLGGSAELPAGLVARGDFNFVASARTRFLNAESFLLRETREIPAQAVLNLRLARRFGAGRSEVFAMGTNLLAPLRKHEDLRQFSVTSGAPIGMVIVIGVSLEAQ